MRIRIHPSVFTHARISGRGPIHSNAREYGIISPRPTALCSRTQRRGQWGAGIGALSLQLRGERLVLCPGEALNLLFTLPPRGVDTRGLTDPYDVELFCHPPLEVAKNIPIDARIVDVLEVRFALGFTLIHLLQLSLIGRGLFSTTGLVKKLYQIG